MLQNYIASFYSAAITCLAAIIVATANMLGLYPEQFNLVGALVILYGLILIVADITTHHNNISILQR